MYCCQFLQHPNSANPTVRNSPAKKERHAQHRLCGCANRSHQDRAAIACGKQQLLSPQLLRQQVSNTWVTRPLAQQQHTCTHTSSMVLSISRHICAMMLVRLRCIVPPHRH